MSIPRHGCYGKLFMKYGGICKTWWMHESVSITHDVMMKICFILHARISHGYKHRFKNINTDLSLGI